MYTCANMESYLYALLALCGFGILVFKWLHKQHKVTGKEDSKMNTPCNSNKQKGGKIKKKGGGQQGPKESAKQSSVKASTEQKSPVVVAEAVQRAVCKTESQPRVEGADKRVEEDAGRQIQSEQQKNETRQCSECATLRENLKKKDTLVEQNKQKIASLENLLTEKNAKCKSYSKVLDSKNAEVKRLKGDLKSSKETESAVEKSLSEKTEEAKRLNRMLTECQEELCRKQAEIERLSAAAQASGPLNMTTVPHTEEYPSVVATNGGCAPSNKQSTAWADDVEQDNAMTQPETAIQSRNVHEIGPLDPAMEEDKESSQHARSHKNHYKEHKPGKASGAPEGDHRWAQRSQEQQQDGRAQDWRQDQCSDYGAQDMRSRRGNAQRRQQEGATNRRGQNRPWQRHASHADSNKDQGWEESDAAVEGCRDQHPDPSFQDNMSEKTGFNQGRQRHQQDRVTRKHAQSNHLQEADWEDQAGDSQHPQKFTNSRQTHLSREKGPNEFAAVGNFQRTEGRDGKRGRCAWSRGPFTYRNQPGPQHERHYASSERSGDSMEKDHSRDLGHRASEQNRGNRSCRQPGSRLSQEKVDKIVQEVEGDLFTCGDEWSLAHCVAEDFRMGSGIAVTFRQNFKRVSELLDQHKSVGEVAILEDGSRFIYYLVTKTISSGKPTLPGLVQCLREMRDHCVSKGVKKLAMPRIGCGLDQLDWKRVKAAIAEVFEDTEIDIVVYNYNLPPDAVTPKSRVRVENYNATLATIETGTGLVFFGAEDNSADESFNTLDNKYGISSQYINCKKELGGVVRIQTSPQGDIAYGLIVRKFERDRFSFSTFEECVRKLKKLVYEDEYKYVAFEVHDNHVAMDKIVTVLKNTFFTKHTCEVAICKPNV